MSLMIGTAVGAAPCKDAKGKFIKCPPPAAATTATSVKTTTTSKTPAKICKTGKPCGNACIAKDKVCHK
jgi:hypothetical protein